MVCSDLEGRLKGGYGQWRRVAAEILMVLSKPKLDCCKEVLLRHPKKEFLRFLQHGDSAEGCDDNGVFRFGGEVDGKQLWAMEKGGGGNSHCLVNAVS